MSDVLVWTDVELHADAQTKLVAIGRIERGQTVQGLPERTRAVIVGTRHHWGAEVWRRAPRLQVLARCGMGFDNVDLDSATAAGVCVVNTPDAPTESTAEFTLALLLAVQRRLPAAGARIADGDWVDGTLRGRDLAGQTLGLVGLGRIGRRVAELAQAFGMRVLAYDPAAAVPTGIERCTTLAQLLMQADVVSLHCPLTSGTHGLLGAAEIAKMKQGAVLLNTARGPLLDETALADALKEGRLAGAGIDVWSEEPVPRDHPLLSLPNVVATPHMAAFTAEGQRRSHMAAAEQVTQVLRGERPAALLNPAVWAKRREPKAQ